MKNFDHISGMYLDTDGAKIYYEVAGNKNRPVLLLLHGGFGNIEDFNTILPELCKNFKIIGIDSRGHGKSTLGTKILTYEQIQKDVENVLAHLNINTLSIMGFSDGGIIAYRLAALTELKIEKLVTIGADWHNKHLMLLKDIFLQINGETWKKKFPESYDMYQKLNPEPDFACLADLIVKMWLDVNTSGYPNEVVKNISCPVLIIRGDDDHLLSRETVIELSRLVKKSSLLNIPFAGHLVFEDQKEIFMISLNEFLQK